MEHDLKPQWDWLEQQPAGTRVVAYDTFRGRHSTWIKMDVSRLQDYNLQPYYYVNVSTGETMHYSLLANLSKPPRRECYASPFVAFTLPLKGK